MDNNKTLKLITEYARLILNEPFYGSIAEMVNDALEKFLLIHPELTSTTDTHLTNQQFIDALRERMLTGDSKDTQETELGDDIQRLFSQLDDQPLFPPRN